MEVRDSGHFYGLDVFDGDDVESIRFMKRTGTTYPGNETSYAGTNCQEVIRVLIDRIKYVQNQIYCPQNTTILQHLRMSLLLFEQRAAERRGRSLPSNLSIHSIETIPTCKMCGHIFCFEKH